MNFLINIIIISIIIISIQYLKFKKRYFTGSIGNIICIIRQQNFWAIIFFTIYYALLTLMLVKNVIKYKSSENIFALVICFLVIFVIIQISAILKYSRKIFISTIGIGCRDPFGRIYDFLEWGKIKDCFIEKNNNKNTYTFSIRLNVKEKMIIWKLNQQEKEEIKEIFVKHKKDICEM